MLVHGLQDQPLDLRRPFRNGIMPNHAHYRGWGIRSEPVVFQSLRSDFASIADKNSDRRESASAHERLVKHYASFLGDHQIEAGQIFVRVPEDKPFLPYIDLYLSRIGSPAQAARVLEGIDFEFKIELSAKALKKYRRTWRMSERNPEKIDSPFINTTATDENPYLHRLDVALGDDVARTESGLLSYFKKHLDSYMWDIREAGIGIDEFVVSEDGQKLLMNLQAAKER